MIGRRCWKTPLCGIVLLLCSASHASVWLQLPFQSETSQVDLGFGHSMLGDKVGPCFAPALRNVVANGNSRVAIRIQDDLAKVADSTTISTTTSLDASAKFGIGGGSASYSSSRRTTNEREANDRHLRVVLDADAVVSSETTFGFKHLPVADQYAKLGSVTLVRGCGPLIVSELTRTFRAVAWITFKFASVSTRNAVAEQLNMAVEGSYGSFSAKVSTTRQVDKVLSTLNEKYDIDAFVEVRGENGLRGVSELTTALSNSKVDPFKSALDGIAALLKANEVDKGAVSKIRLEPIETLYPGLELVPWNRRQEFWTTASEVYLALLGLDEIRRLTERARRFVRDGGPPDEELVSRAQFEFCSRAKTEPSLSKNFLRNCREPNDTFALRERITGLMNRCLGAKSEQSFHCNPSNLLIALYPILRWSANSEWLYLRTQPPGFGPEAGDTYERDDGSTGEISDQKRIYMAQLGVNSLIGQFGETDVLKWDDRDNQMVLVAIDCCLQETRAYLLSSFTEGVDLFLEKLFENRASVYAVDMTSRENINIALVYSESKPIFLFSEGVYLLETLEVTTETGDKLVWQFKQPTMMSQASEFMFWYGKSDNCAREGGPKVECEPHAKAAYDFLVNVKKSKGALRVTGKTIAGKFNKQVASFSTE